MKDLGESDVILNIKFINDVEKVLIRIFRATRTPSTLLLLIIPMWYFERSRKLLRINWNTLRLSVRSCTYRVQWDLTYLLLWVNWEGSCQTGQILSISMNLSRLCATWSALWAMGFNIMGIRLYLRDTVIQSKFITLTSFMPWVGMCVNLGGGVIS